MQLQGDAIDGVVLHIDRFGNLITNIPDHTLRAFLSDGETDLVTTKVAALRVRVLGQPLERITGPELERHRHLGGA